MFENQEPFSIELPSEVSYTTRPAESVTVSAITVGRMVDFPSEKKVVVHTHEVGELLLWQGEEYDAIGQWTDADVAHRIVEILST